MEETSTTAEGNSTTDGAASTTTGAESTTTATETQTGATGADNLDTSTSTDTSAADDKSTTGEEETPPALTIDNDLDDWAEKTGRAKPETEREKALYQEIRNGQREFSKSKEAKTAKETLNTATDELKPEEGEDETEDELEKRLNKVEADRNAERTARLQSEFFTEHSVTDDTAKVMGDILKEKVERAKTPEAKKREFDYWTDPEHLQDWHDLAKARVGAGNVDTAALQEEAAQKERERIEKESQANGPSRGATQRTGDKTPEQKRNESLLERWSK